MKEKVKKKLLGITTHANILVNPFSDMFMYEYTDIILHK